MADNPTVALLGTGTMGAAMAGNLATAGFPLRVWNRNADRAKPLARAGATVAGSPGEAVTGADIVITMLWDADSVASALDQAGDALAPGTVWVQMSTVGVEGAQHLAEMAERRELVFVDAPVLGSRKPAEDGTLVVLASGPDSAQLVVAPIFEAMGSRTMWVGPAGAGTRLKLVANAWVLTMIEGIAECMALAGALGVDPELFLKAVRGGAMDAPYLSMKGHAILSGDYDPAFTLSGAAKDADLILDAASVAGADIGVLQAVRDHLARAVADGHGNLDMAATYLSHRPA